MARLGSLLLKHPSKCPSEPARDRHQSQRAGNCGEITANKAEFIKKLLLTGIIIIWFHCFVPKICIFKPISSWDHLRSVAKLTPSVKNGINFRAVNPKGPDNPRIPRIPACSQGGCGIPKSGAGSSGGLTTCGHSAATLHNISSPSWTWNSAPSKFCTQMPQKLSRTMFPGESYGCGIVFPLLGQFSPMSHKRGSPELWGMS